MFNFLKICGYGLLAIVLSPIWVSLLALMAVYGLVAFLVMTIRIIVIDIHNLFAKDKTSIKDPLGPLEEDYEVQRIKAAQEAVAVDIVSSSKPSEVVTVQEVTPIEDENDDTSAYQSLEDNSPLSLEEQEVAEQNIEEEEVINEEAGELDD